MKSKSIKSQKGSVPLLEAVITLPVLLILIFTFIQLVLYVNAKFLVKYAAFCAARAGIVYAANPVLMQKAACIALAPLFSSDQKEGYKIAAQNASIPSDEKMISVYTIAGGYVQDEATGYERTKRFFPTMKKYQDGLGYENAIDTTRLAVMVVLKYPVTIPIVRGWLKEIRIADTWVSRMQTDGYVDKNKEEIVTNLLKYIDSYFK